MSTPPDNISNCMEVLDNQLSISPHIANQIQSCRFLFQEDLVMEAYYLLGQSLAVLILDINSFTWWIFSDIPFDLCNWGRIKVYNLFITSLSPPASSPQQGYTWSTIFLDQGMHQDFSLDLDHGGGMILPQLNKQPVTHWLSLIKA